MNVLKTCAFLLSLSILSACENDIEINAPWKEIPVVYGLLDINQPAQYIRIQKAYQNSIDLTTAEGAQISDSLYFDSLIVTIGNDTMQKIDTVALSKDPGLFSSSRNILYKSLKPLVSGGFYKLNIYNPYSGKNYTSSTQVVAKSTITSSTTYKFFIRPYQNFNRITFPFQPASNGFVFDALMRLKYKEYPVGNPAAFTIKNADYLLDKNITGVPASGKLYNPLSRDVIYYFKTNIPANAAVTRELVEFSYVVIAGSKELKDIIDLSKPSAVLIQRKTDYSNITDGLGIFSSRSETVRNNIPFQDDSSRIYLLKDLPNFIF